MKYRKDDLTDEQYQQLIQSEIQFALLLEKAHQLFQDGKAKQLRDITKELANIAFRFYMASDE